MFNSMRTLVLAGLVAALLALPAAPAPAQQSEQQSEQQPAVRKPRSQQLVSKPVAIPVVNTNDTTVLCAGDGGAYELRGRLVGTRAQVNGRTGAERINVLVHDFAAGGWFWHLRAHPAYDYATQLARKGEISLVLDRLGYDGSPLADGRSTCLGAQAHMLHQAVQHLRAGTYFFAHDRRKDPVHAARVVLHGHSVGAAIAQLEAGTFSDVDGLVLMSWSDAIASSPAVRAASEQVAACLGGADYAPYGASAASYRSLFFRTAPAAVQRTAVRLRNPDPCGDAASLAPTLLASGLAARRIDVPVLLLFGQRDAQVRADAAENQAGAYARDAAVTTRTVAGAASALPLESSAPATRRHVLRWLRSQD
jgi:hypothetical protein